MKNLLTRLAMANGPNARLCHQANVEIHRLKKLVLEEMDKRQDEESLTITREKFIEATGYEPVDDDLERCNCSIRGTMHSFCGWCATCDAPFYQCGGMKCSSSSE